MNCADCRIRALRILDSNVLWVSVQEKCIRTYGRVRAFQSCWLMSSLRDIPSSAEWLSNQSSMFGSSLTCVYTLIVLRVGRSRKNSGLRLCTLVRTITFLQPPLYKFRNAHAFLFGRAFDTLHNGGFHPTVESGAGFVFVFAIHLCSLLSIVYDNSVAQFHKSVKGG